jgi:hypothetical protein
MVVNYEAATALKGSHGQVGALKEELSGDRGGVSLRGHHEVFVVDAGTEESFKYSPYVAGGGNKTVAVLKGDDVGKWYQHHGESPVGGSIPK